MSGHNSLALLACATLAFLLGCGDGDTVTVDRSSPDAAGGVAYSPSSPQPTSGGDTRGGTSSTNGATAGNRPAAGSSTNDTVTAVDGQPTGRYGTGTGGTSSTNPPSGRQPVDGAGTRRFPVDSDYRVTLETGRTIDVGALLNRERTEFERRLEAVANGRQQISVYYSDGERFMLIGRVTGTLRGPTATYYDNGRPMAYVTYVRDSKRDGTLISWDEQGRPVVLEQFRGGKRNGLHALFRTSGDDDPTGRVTLVQEWSRGNKTATHVVTEAGQTLTYTDPSAPLDPANSELTVAIAELEEFDETLSKNEVVLAKAVAAFYRNEVRYAKLLKQVTREQAQALAVQARMQIINQLMSGTRSPDDWRNNRSGRGLR